MAIKNTQRGLVSPKRSEGGFALLIAVIFMSVMLTFGLELASIGYKQQVLASSALGSQYAFFAADAALECALYADQQQNLFDYASHSVSSPAPLITCDGATATLNPGGYLYDAGINGRLLVSQRVPLDNGSHCADVMVSKPNPSSSTKTTYLYSQGYDVPCETVATPGNARFASRGLSASYGI